MIAGLDMLYAHNRRSEAERDASNPFVQMKRDPELRHEAIRRLKARGHKQPKVDQIIAEIRRMIS